MKVNCLYFILFISLCACHTTSVVTSQDENAPEEEIPVDEASNEKDVPNIFAYATNGDNGKNVLSLNSKEADTITEPYQIKVVQGVLDRLIEAKGDRRMQKPQLVWTGKYEAVAWVDANNVKICLEPKAYEVCTSFGADSLNAIAALLGHEITHYYEKHIWSKNFYRENKKDVAAAKQVMETMLNDETQSDYLGGFLGFSAGFNTLGIMPRMLEKAYEVYGLPPELPGYPSLADRKKIAEKSMEQLEDLVHVFETANYLTAIGQYEDARVYYQFILKDFQSREIYNNMGVSAIIEALEYFDKKKLKYAMPVEFDAVSRMSTSTKGDGMGWAQRKQKRLDLLNFAIEQFEVATEMDESYAIGFLNMANAYTLLEEEEESKNYRKAQFNLEEAKALAEKTNQQKTLSDVYILEAIIADKDNEQSKVVSLFDKAIDLGSELAKLNKNIFEDKPNPEIVASLSGFSLKKENIDNIDLDEFQDAIDADKSFKVGDKTTFGIKKLENSKILIHIYDGGDRFALLQITNEDYEGKSGKGIQVGDLVTTLSDSQNYGTSSKHFEYGGGQYLLYDKLNLLFITEVDDSNKNRVKQWITYRAVNNKPDE